MASALWTRYLHLLGRYPLVTMSSTTGTIMSGGDCICQFVIERRQLADYDKVRTGRYFAIGFCLFGPIMRGWYLTLDRMYSKSKFAAVKMMVTDQICMAPVFVGTFLTGMGLLRMEDFEKIKSRLQRDYGTILMNNYKVWPLAQLINFYFLPLHHRVLFVNFVALGWNTYLAWASERD